MGYQFRLPRWEVAPRVPPVSQLATLAAVLEHYNEAPLAMIGHNESKPLELSRRQLAQLELRCRQLQHENNRLVSGGTETGNAVMV